MALAVAVEHQMRAAAEDEVRQTKVMVVEEEAEGGVPKKMECSVRVLASGVVEVAMDWRMDCVDRAEEEVEVDQEMAVVQRDLWEEAGGVLQP